MRRLPLSPADAQAALEETRCGRFTVKQSPEQIGNLHDGVQPALTLEWLVRRTRRCGLSFIDTVKTQLENGGGTSGSVSAELRAVGLLFRICLRDLIRQHLAASRKDGPLDLNRRVPQTRADQRPPTVQESLFHRDPRSGERQLAANRKRRQKFRIRHDLRPHLDPQRLIHSGNEEQQADVGLNGQVAQRVDLVKRAEELAVGSDVEPLPTASYTPVG